MEGWLHKKGGGLSFGFSKKYVQLENFQLHFFSSPTDRSSKDTFDLRTCTIVSDVPPTAGDPASQLEFQIVAAKKKILLRAQTGEEKVCWLRVLTPFNNVANILANGGSIPLAPVFVTGLSACIDALTRDGCVQGIFRESGKLEEVKGIYQAFIRGAQHVPSGADVHAVAGCLKKFLRELPETLFTNRLFEQVVAPNPTPAKLTAFVACLPQPNRSLLVALIELLYLIVCHSNTTRMDVKNLSIVLTPNFTRKDQPGVILPLEPFWHILINNKDTVLYGGNPKPQPTPQKQPPTSQTAPTPKSNLTPTNNANATSPTPAKSPTQTGVNTSATSTSTSSSRPNPLQIPPSSPNASLSTSPPSEPAQSPAISYQSHNPSIAPPNPSPSRPSMSPGADHSEAGADSLLDDKEEDLDSLFPTEDTSLLLDDAGQAHSAASKQKAAPKPSSTPAAAKPAAKPGTSAPQVPLALRLMSTFDHSDEDEEDKPPPSRSNLRTIGGLAGRKKPTDDDDDMNLFDDSGDMDDLVSQSARNAEAIRSARASRAGRSAMGQLGVGSTVTPSTSATTASTATAAATATASTTKSATVTSPPAPPQTRRTLSKPLSPTTVQAQTDELKNSFGFDDSIDDATLSLLTDRKGAADGAGGGGDESIDLNLTEDPSQLTIDSPLTKDRSASAVAAATKSIASAPQPSPPPPHELFNSSFDDPDDFPQPASHQPLQQPKSASVKASQGVKPPSQADDLGLSRIERGQPDQDEDDRSLLSLASDLSLGGPSMPPASPSRPLKAKQPEATDDGTLTFGDDTDFDLTNGDDGSIKENVFGGRPNNVAASANQPPKTTSATPARTKATVAPPLSAVKEKHASEEDELSLSLDGSFSSSPAPKPPLGRSAAIAAAAARIRAARMGGDASTASSNATAAATKPTQPPATLKPVLSDDDQFSLDLDSQLHSPPKNAVASQQQASVMPKTPAPVAAQSATNKKHSNTAASAASSTATASAAAVRAPATAQSAVQPTQPERSSDNDLDYDDHSLSLFSTVADDSLNLLSGMDISERPPPKPSAPVTAAKKAEAAKPPAPTAHSNLSSQSTKHSVTTAPTAVSANTTVNKAPNPTAASATAVPKSAAPTAKSISNQPTPAAASATAPNNTSFTPSLTDEPIGASISPSHPPPSTSSGSTRDDSGELIRLHREIRRLEVLNLELQGQLSSTSDALTSMTARADDADKRVAALTLGASEDVREAFQRAEAHAEQQAAKIAQRYTNQIGILTKRAEDAEAASLAHLAAKDEATQRSIDANELLTDARLQLTQSESALKSALSEKSYLQSELNKRDAALSSKRAELSQLQLKFDSLRAERVEHASQSQDSAHRYLRDVEELKEKLRRVTQEREELFVEKSIALKQSHHYEKELQDLRSSLLSPSHAGGSSTAHAALVQSRNEREREQKAFEQERATWTTQKQQFEAKLQESDERFRKLLQAQTDLESDHQTLQSKYERIELQNLSKVQKLSYLHKALDAVEFDHLRRLRALSSALAVKALTVEHTQSRLALLESTLERHAPSEVFAKVLEATEESRRVLADEIDIVQKEMSGSSGAAVIAGILERFPALHNLAHIVKYVPLSTGGTAGAGSGVAGLSSASSISTLAPSTAFSTPLATSRTSAQARSGASTYRSSIEFIPLTTQTNVNGSFLHRNDSAYSTNHREEEKSKHDPEPSSISPPILSAYKPIPPLASTFADFAAMTSRSTLSAPSYTAPQSVYPSLPSTARSHVSSISSFPPPSSSPLFHRVHLDENRRQLSQIEAKAQAQLAASQQRLLNIEASLAQVQQQQAKQQSQQIN